MKEKDFYWLAGLLEGEGCFMRLSPSNSFRVICLMTDEDVIARVANLLKCKCCHRVSKNPKRKDVFVATLTGTRAIKLMQALHPVMGERRQKRIEEILISYYLKSPRKNVTRNDVSKILERLKTGTSQKVIAKEFGVRLETICRVNRGKIRGRVEIDYPKVAMVNTLSKTSHHID